MDIIARKSGIYQINDRNSNCFYIGSSIDLYRRRKDHINRLKRNAHDNYKLQNAFNKDNKRFKFQVILYCKEEDILLLEQKYLDKYKPYYNICTDATGTCGYSHSEETKRKMSEAKKKFFEEGGEPWNKGKTIPQYAKDQISETLKELYKDKNNHPMYGKNHTEESKKLIIAGLKERKGTHHRGPSGRIIKMDKDTLEPLQEYISTGEAAKDVQANGTLKTTRTKIAESVKHDRNAYGFKWKYIPHQDQ